MSELETFERLLTQEERELLSALTSPERIQNFLDHLSYGCESIYRCPLHVLREKRGDCFDGAIFAAAALRRLGYEPAVVKLVPNERDDNHLLTLFRREGHWGAVAKSNFVGLRYREPVYRNVHELVMSYFEPYYNVVREKTLRAYTGPLYLKKLDKYHWMTNDLDVKKIPERLRRMKAHTLLTQAMIDFLSLVDERYYEAGLHGSVAAGLFKIPEENKGTQAG